MWRLDVAWTIPGGAAPERRNLNRQTEQDIDVEAVAEFDASASPIHLIPCDGRRPPSSTIS